MPSNGKNTTVRGVRWAPVMPTARPRNVGARARHEPAARRLTLQQSCMPAAKIVPLLPDLIPMDIDVHARSRFDRFSHHAHGQGGWIAGPPGTGDRAASGRASPRPVAHGASAKHGSLSRRSKRSRSGAPSLGPARPLGTDARDGADAQRRRSEEFLLERAWSRQVA